MRQSRINSKWTKHKFDNPLYDKQILKRCSFCDSFLGLNQRPCVRLDASIFDSQTIPNQLSIRFRFENRVGSTECLRNKLHVDNVSHSSWLTMAGIQQWRRAFLAISPGENWRIFNDLPGTTPTIRLPFVERRLITTQINMTISNVWYFSLSTFLFSLSPSRSIYRFAGYKVTPKRIHHYLWMKQYHSINKCHK